MERALVLQVDAENPDVGDLALSAGESFLRTVLGDEVAQRILVRLSFFKGEYFRNLDAGMAWLQVVFEKGCPDETIRAWLVALIGTTEGVAGVDKLDFTRDAPSRSLDITFTARLQDGSTFVSRHYGPFVLDVPGA